MMNSIQPHAASPHSMQKTGNSPIDRIFADTWLLACQLRNGSEINEGEAFYHRVCQLIDETRKNLEEHGYAAESVDNMLYAQCALIDESVMNRKRDDDGYKQWIQSPLQARYFNTLEAGDKLWDRLRGLLNEIAPNPDVLICFHRVIALGFVGKFHQIDNAQRQHIVKQLTESVPAYALTASLPLVERPKQRLNRRRLFWLSLIGGIILLTVLWWGLSASLEQLLQQWILQG